jgi:hypothetical protein
MFARLISLTRGLESYLWDKWMRVDTAHSRDTAVVQGTCTDSHEFQTNAHSTIRQLIKRVKPGPSDTIIVLGCAKGRALCHFARLNVRGVIGIEISAKLARIAESNALRLRGRRAPIEVREVDAAVANLSEGSIFYMFNPFGERTLCAVLAGLERTHLPTGRPLTIIYVNPRFGDVCDRVGWLSRREEMRRVTGLHAVIYESRDVKRGSFGSLRVLGALSTQGAGTTGERDKSFVGTPA